MRFSRILYGNTDIGGGSGWRVIASSAGVDPTVMARVPFLCNNLLEKVRNQNVDIHFFWERKGLAGNDLFVQVQRKAKDAYGRPDASLVFLAFPREETMPLASVPRVFLHLFGELTDWESASAAGGILQPARIPQDRLHASLNDFEVGENSQLIATWIDSLDLFLNSNKAYAPKSLLFPADGTIKGVEVVGIAQNDGRVIFGTKKRRCSVMSTTVHPAFIGLALLALVSAWGINRIGDLEVALAKSQANLGAKEWEQQRLQNEVDELRDEKKQQFEELKDKKNEIAGLTEEIVELKIKNKEYKGLKNKAVAKESDWVENHVLDLENENQFLQGDIERYKSLTKDLAVILERCSQSTSGDYHKIFDQLGISHDPLGDGVPREILKYNQHRLSLNFIGPTADKNAYFSASAAKYRDFVTNSTVWQLVSDNGESNKRNSNYIRIRPKMGRETEAIKELIKHARTYRR